MSSIPTTSPSALLPLVRLYDPDSEFYPDIVTKLVAAPPPCRACRSSPTVCDSLFSSSLSPSVRSTRMTSLRIYHNDFYMQHFHNSQYLQHMMDEMVRWCPSIRISCRNVKIIPYGLYVWKWCKSIERDDLQKRTRGMMFVNEVQWSHLGMYLKMFTQQRSLLTHTASSNFARTLQRGSNSVATYKVPTNEIHVFPRTTI